MTAPAHKHPMTAPGDELRPPLPQIGEAGR